LTFGFTMFFLLERFVYWYHGHMHGYDSDVDEGVRIKRLVYLNLIGDAIHNLLDGMIITVGFFVSISLGLAATVAVLFHELPQGVGDLVLVYGGFTRTRVLMFNFISATTAFVRVYVASYFSVHIQNFVWSLTAFTAGGFIYLSASELIPEMQKQEGFQKSLIQFVMLLIGVSVVWFLSYI